MINSFYTLKYKVCDCPLWLTKVKIAAKYRFYEGSNNKVHLVTAECNIVKNLQLPRSKQDKSLELYRYCNYKDCPCLKGFEKEIVLH